MSTSDRGNFRRPDERRDQPLLNERIRDREVRLIDEEGGQLGIVLTREALQIARDKGLDLLLVQPDANPPVAKILDFDATNLKLKNEPAKPRKNTILLT